MNYIQDPINGEFYPEDYREKQLKALIEEQQREKKANKLAFWIWFVNGCLIGWLIVFWWLRCI